MEFNIFLRPWYDTGSKNRWYDSLPGLIKAGSNILNFGVLASTKIGDDEAKHFSSFTKKWFNKTTRLTSDPSFLDDCCADNLGVDKELCSLLNEVINLELVAIEYNDLKNIW